MNRTLRVALLAAVICTVAAAECFSASVPGTFTYQGKLATPDGKPLHDDRYELAVGLFTAETGGTAFWSTETSVITSRGIFSLELGPFTAADLNRSAIWLEVVLQGGEPFPRQRVNAVPFAIRANDLALPFSGTMNYFNPLFSIDQTGTGSGALFMIHNPANNGYGLYAYTNGTNNALYAASAGSGDSARFEKTTGAGSAAYFKATGSTNQGSAILAYSTTSGPVIKATTDGPATAAGVFKVENDSSTQPAIYASTDGSGSAVYAYNGNNGRALSGYVAGSGTAVYANASYTGSAIVAESSASGVVADIKSTNTATVNPVLKLSNAGGNNAATLQVNHTGLGTYGIESSAPDGAVAGYFTATGQFGAPAVYINTNRDYTPALQVGNDSAVDPVAATFRGEVRVNGKFEVSGDAEVTGNISAGAYGVGMPLGYAYFNSSGTRLKGTTNLSCTRITGTGMVLYQIHIAGQTYSEGSHLILITPMTSSGATVAHCWPYNGDIRAEFRYLSSNTPAYCGFSIVIY